MRGYSLVKELPAIAQDFATQAKKEWVRVRYSSLKVAYKSSGALPCLLAGKSSLGLNDAKRLKVSMLGRYEREKVVREIV